MVEHLRRYRGVFLGALALVLVLTLLSIEFWRNGRAQAAQRLETRLLICEEIETLKNVQRTALSEDIAETRRFLRKNPDGVPGIPADLIRRGIARDKVAMSSLAPVPGGCTEFALSR